MKRKPKEEVQRILIAAAHQLLTDQGVDGVKARPMAEATGYSVGTIYNMFGSMDGLLMVANADTFDLLRQVGERAARDSALTDEEDRPTDTVTRRLMAIADAYADFVRDNNNRWTAALAFNRSYTGKLPNWYRARLFSLFNIIEGVLVDLPRLHDDRKERSIVARALFSSVNGIVGSAVGSTITASVVDSIRRQNRIVITAVVARYSL